MRVRSLTVGILVTFLGMFTTLDTIHTYASQLDTIVPMVSTCIGCLLELLGLLLIWFNEGI